MRRQIRTTLLLLAIALTVEAGVSTDDLIVEKLTWAGIKLAAGDTTVFVDAVGTDIWDGNAPGGLVTVAADTARRYALITHAHNDHFDEAALKAVLGDRGYVICHESIATYIASRGLRVIAAKTWTPIRRGGFVFTAVPAADGFGAEQVSWVVAHGERKYLHAGDTLWHGDWDLIGAQHGPFDVVFLPINGARLQREPMQETPGVLTPAQAVDAAIMLGADWIVPIHYGGHAPPFYLEVPRPLEELLDAARRRGIAVQALGPGERLKR